MNIRINNHMVSLNVTRVPDLYTMGVSNELSDNMFVLFLDYDNVDYEVVCKDVYHINKVFGLCGFVVLCNSESVMKNMGDDESLVGNYNVIGLDRITYQKVMEIQAHTRCDDLHRKVHRYAYKRRWIIRLAGKYDDDNEFKPAPTLKDVIIFKNSECKHSHSEAFIKLFNRWFKENIYMDNVIRDGPLDFEDYLTNKVKP